MENTYKKPLLEEGLTYKLRGIFFKIGHENGFLYKEKAYQNILMQQLANNNINFINKPRIPIFNPIDGKFISNYYPDFLIENKIIIEIKAQNQLLDTHINQLMRYLNCSKYEIGLIVNFGLPKVQIIRRIYTNDRKPFLMSAD